MEKRVFISGMTFMCEKPHDRQLITFSDDQDVYHVINPDSGRVVWRNLNSSRLQHLFDDGFYRFNPEPKQWPPSAPMPYRPKTEVVGGGGGGSKAAAADSVELHFGNGTVVTVSVK